MTQEDDLTARARKQVGRFLRDKWRLDRLLGVGGMASVFAATHRNGSRVAVKMLHPEVSINAEIKRRFLREGYVANTVAHRGAVRALDDDTSEDGSVFLVMELLEGRSLESRLLGNGGPLGPEEVAFIADQLLDVLEAAHSKGVVHRDIKPANVFLTPDGVVKVLDFGIARLRLGSDTASMATQAGSTMGTPAFMAPEQALGKADLVGPRSDVWAVGATLYTLLTNQFVHGGESANEQLVLAATRHAPSLAANPGAIPLPLAQIIDRALAFDLADRWPSARAMQQALREMQGTDASSYIHTARSVWDVEAPESSRALPPFAPLASSAPSPSRFPRGALVAALVAGSLLAGFAAYSLVLRASSASSGPPAPAASALLAPSAPSAASAPPAPSAPPAASAPSAPSAATAPPPAATEAPAASGAAVGAGKAPARPAARPPAKAPAAGGGDWLDRQH